MKPGPIEKPCVRCGTIMHVWPYEVETHKFCSVACRRNRVSKTCIKCGRVFEVRATRAEQAQYCSRSCLGLDNAVRLNETRKPPTANSGSFRKGSNTGRENHMWVPALAFTCRHCGSVFYRKPFEVRRSNPTYCSAACRSDYRRLHQSGSNSPFWNGGPRTYRGRAWREIRALVIERQGGCCAACGRLIGKSLPVHHIRPFRDFASATEANSLNNLIGLCQSCHMKQEYAQGGVGEAHHP
jgi:5-methylcytosine-specific restriction protein A